MCRKKDDFFSPKEEREQRKIEKWIKERKADKLGDWLRKFGKEEKLPKEKDWF